MGPAMLCTYTQLTKGRADVFEIAQDWLKANIPVCGKTMAKSVEDLKGMLDPDG